MVMFHSYVKLPEGFPFFKALKRWQHQAPEARLAAFHLGMVGQLDLVDTHQWGTLALLNPIYPYPLPEKSAGSRLEARNRFV